MTWMISIGRRSSAVVAAVAATLCVTSSRPVRAQATPPDIAVAISNTFFKDINWQKIQLQPGAIARVERTDYIAVYDGRANGSTRRKSAIYDDDWSWGYPGPVEAFGPGKVLDIPEGIRITPVYVCTVLSHACKIQIYHRPHTNSAGLFFRGRLYFSEETNHVISSFAVPLTDPKPRLLVGPATHLYGPVAVGAFADGSLVVLNDTQVLYNPSDRGLLIFAPGATGNTAPIAEVNGLLQTVGAYGAASVPFTVDRTNNWIFTANVARDGIVSFNRDLTLRTIITGPDTGLHKIQDIAVDEDGRLCAIDHNQLIDSGHIPPDSVGGRIVCFAPGAVGDAAPVQIIEAPELKAATSLNFVAR